MILAVESENNQIRNIKALAIRRMPYRDSYILGKYIVDYFVIDEIGRKMEYRQEINTPKTEITFIDYINEIPTKDDYTKEELVYWEE